VSASDRIGRPRVGNDVEISTEQEELAVDMMVEEG
jgi:hypothetical protein